jgi:hypothetical protein
VSGASWDRLTPGISDPEQWQAEQNARDPRWIASEARRLVQAIDQRKRDRSRTVTGDTEEMHFPTDNGEAAVQAMTFRKDEE